MASMAMLNNQRVNHHVSRLNSSSAAAVHGMDTCGDEGEGGAAAFFALALGWRMGYHQ
jgi:hypothetical protein